MKNTRLYFKNTFFWLLAGLLFTSCNLEKAIDFELPPYQSQLVVECYLEHDKPYRMLLTESSGYFDKITDPIVSEALVIITKDGVPDTLQYNLQPEPETGKIFNFSSKTKAVFDPNASYFLYIKDGKGRVVQGEARFLTPVPIDTVEVKFNDKNKAYLLMKFTDPAPNVTNLYRFTVTGDSAINDLDINFAFEDKLFETPQGAVGTGYDFLSGDSVVTHLYHIDKKYYDFLESVEDAVSANGNPFAQPAQVKSTVAGGLGVFTALSYDSVQMIIP